MFPRRGLASLASLVTLGALGASAPALAGENDLVMTRLGRIVESGGTPVDVVGGNLEFRSLVSELGVVLAPRLLSPSDTIGYGGFQFSADVGWTSISSDADYWRVRHGSDVMDGAAAPGLLQTVGLFARKGMWFPVPSVEVGVGATHLMSSRMWTGQAYAKLGIHEGYHDLPIPSLAVRGAAARLMGNRDLDLTVASVDVSISKHVGVGGTWSLDPYGGWNVLVIIPRSEVIDATPNIDSLAPGNNRDRSLNFVFKDQDDILRHRFFVGAKLDYYVFALIAEADFALAGRSVDDRPATDDDCTVDAATDRCDSTDQSGAQQTYTVSLAFDF